ncbi:MAG: metallophosphoesterase family protein [Candidatus Pacearchaeota archaeon]|nr:MAG: metallophosphoesterase family protein [Candidatus Pacearchaeota archaeon]
MKILYTTDPHEDIAMLQEAGKFGLEQKVDLWLAGGDFIDIPWNLQESHDRYKKAVNELLRIREQRKFNGSLEELALEVAEQNVSSGLKQIGEDYIAMTGVAKNNMKERYKKMVKVFDEIDIPSKTLPGNYDNNELMNEIFENSLHLNKEELKLNDSKLTIAGYGGAPEWPSWIPHNLIVPFNEEIHYDKKGNVVGGRSEAVDFFRKNKSDIIITHTHPQSILDYILNGMGKVEGSNRSAGGSFGLRVYLNEIQEDKNPSFLWLCGHMHTSNINKGAKKCGKTVVINPGSLSRYRGAIKGAGTFAIIDTENKKFEKAIIYAVSDKENERIFPIEEYYITDRGFNKLELLC